MKYFIFLFIFFTNYSVYAQNERTNSNYNIDLPNIPYYSPEAASLGKYGEIPISEYTGVPKIEVPLYTVKSGELELPITLSYHASGIKVNQEATWVGLGWDLMAGGCINYHVEGDYGSRDIPTNFFNKFFRGTHNDGSDAPEITNFMYTPGENDTYYEIDDMLFSKGYMQDIYQGSFCGISTMFITKPQSSTGTPEIIEIGKIEGNNRIECSGSFNNNIPTNTVEWVITDNMGIKYTFGPMGQEGYEIAYGQRPEYPITWFLTQIEHPSKGRITLNYGEICEIYPVSNIIHSSTKLQKQDDVCLYHLPENYEPGFYYSSNTPYDAAKYVLDIQEIERDKNYTAAVDKMYKHYLQSITTENETIEFHLGNREDIRGQSKKLEYILVKNLNDSIIKRIDFEYSYFDASASGYDGKRLKLDGMNLNGKEYNFSYENIILPSKKTFSQDFWGYYNGKSNFTLIPAIYGISPTAANRFVDPFFINAGMLNKITYPTKGSTEFVFEPNRVENTPQVFREYYFNYFSDYRKCVGGLRIKEIKNFDSGHILLEKTTFEYFDGRIMQPFNIIENDHLGILSSFGENNEKEYHLFKSRTVYSSPRVPLITTLCTPLIGYRRVETSVGNTKTISYFNVVSTDSTSWALYLGTKENCNHDSYLINNECATPIDLNAGALSRRSIMQIQENGELTMLRDSYYTEDVVNLHPVWVNAYAKRLFYGGFGYLSLSERGFPYFEGLPLYRIFAYPLSRRRHNKIVEETYYGEINSTEDVLEDITTFSYNNNHLLSEQNSTQQNKIIKYNYSHPNTTMQNKNIIAWPYEIKELYIKENRDTITINRNRFNYDIKNNHVVLKSCDWAKGDEPYSCRISYLYDNDGNIVQAMKNDSIPVSYVWAYNNTLPVMKIVGTRYNQIPSDIINQLKSSISSSEISSLMDRITNTLNSATALISKYTFIPLIGLSSETLPNGKKTSYTYDSDGRLLQIKDDYGNITNSFEYNFAQ